MLLAAAVLTACSGLLDSKAPPVRTYWLEPLEGPGPTAEGPTLSVRVHAVPGLDTNRLLTLGPGQALSHFSGARWAGASPEMAASLLTRSLSDSGRYSRVGREGRLRDAECDLDLELQRFFTRLNENQAPRTVEIKLEGVLRCGTTAQAIRISADQRVAGGDASGVVAAHQQAMNTVTRELIS
ncbi:MAG: ABC-type transport auxiliary lipoprotein family protein, partial [Xanthomonadales bacterium]|nr:ABC-type transport auxiliary lipoprotein family protein [Xanthomonadales bacterium]